MMAPGGANLSSLWTPSQSGHTLSSTELERRELKKKECEHPKIEDGVMEGAHQTFLLLVKWHSQGDPPSIAKGVTSSRIWINLV